MEMETIFVIFIEWLCRKDDPSLKDSLARTLVSDRTLNGRRIKVISFKAAREEADEWCRDFNCAITEMEEDRGCCFRHSYFEPLHLQDEPFPRDYIRERRDW